MVRDGHHLIMWRTDHNGPRQTIANDPSVRHIVRTILLSTITDHVLSRPEYEVLSDDTRRLSEVRLRIWGRCVTRSRQKSATETDVYCESFRYQKSVEQRPGPDVNAFCSSAGCCRGASSSPHFQLAETVFQQASTRTFPAGLQFRGLVGVAYEYLAMGEIFIGSEAVANGVVTRHELARWYRPIYPNVHAPRGCDLTLHDRILGAWLWSKRNGIITGVAASALHGADWVDPDASVELILNCTRPPRGVVTRNERIAQDEIC